VDPSTAFSAEPDSLRAIRRAVREQAQGAGASPRVVAAAVTAVNEAATNAIVHGYEGGSAEQVVRVETEAAAGWLRLVVSDDGPGLRPRRHSPGVGLGMAIIAQLADDLQVTQQDGLQVRMGFRLDAA
jgi:anti-sigma regulatory factor (Ser/Thr protein kinase)